MMEDIKLLEDLEPQNAFCMLFLLQGNVAKVSLTKDKNATV
jgi:hypothetical protein